MGYAMGIDLGSTTSKAVIIDDDDQIVGEGLTNTRSNYLIAVKVAEEDAKLDLKLRLLGSAMADGGALGLSKDGLFESLLYAFRHHYHRRRVEKLKEYCLETLNQEVYRGKRGNLQVVLNEVFRRMDERSGPILKRIISDKASFFRDMICLYADR
jgi:benzoyl-CoA reductase subunit A